MPDPRLIQILLIGVAVGVLILRVLAFRGPKRRGAGPGGAVVIYIAILALVVGVLAWSVVNAYIGAFPR